MPDSPDNVREGFCWYTRFVGNANSGFRIPHGSDDNLHIAFVHLEIMRLLDAELCDDDVTIDLDLGDVHDPASASGGAAINKDQLPGIPCGLDHGRDIPADPGNAGETTKTFL